MTRVLVVGAGKRSLGGLLPAIHCLGWEIAGVRARTPREVQLMDGRLRLDVAVSYAGIDFSRVDLILVAAGAKNVPGTLRDLSEAGARGCALLVDTPVLPLRKLGALHALSAFRRALVTEETRALPPYVLARRLIAEGRIGDLRRIWMFHGVSGEHALAGLRMLADRREVDALRSRSYPGKLLRKDLRLGDVGAVLYEPRDDAKAKLLLRGERGFIADYAFAGTPVTRIGYRTEGPLWLGMTVDGGEVPQDDRDRLYLERMSADVPDLTPMNAMKIRALMDLLPAALEESSPLHYRPDDALADGFAVLMSETLGRAPSTAVLKRMLPTAVRMLPGKKG